MNGIESARLILSVLPETVVIGMSTDASELIETEVISAGARAFIPKELMPGRLVHVITRALPLPILPPSL